ATRTRGGTVRPDFRTTEDAGVSMSVARAKSWVGVAVAAMAVVVAAPAAKAAGPSKVVRIAFLVAETGFDPAKVSDLYSSTVIEAIFERLYTYDYLARPVKIVPLTADGMPEISDGGRTWTIHLKHGIFFAADPAFGGKPRELTAGLCVQLRAPRR